MEEGADIHTHPQRVQVSLNMRRQNTHHFSIEEQGGQSGNQDLDSPCNPRFLSAPSKGPAQQLSGELVYTSVIHPKSLGTLFQEEALPALLPG